MRQDTKKDTAKKRIPFKEGLFHVASSPSERAYLIGSKCTRCGLVTFPKREVCLSCLTDNTMKELPLSGKGKVDSFCVVWQGAPGFNPPYIQAWIRLVDGPKVFTTITGCEPKDDALKIGQQVEMVIDEIREDEQGNEIIGWKFRPTAQT